MAITYYQIPANYSPSDNPLRYTFGSDQTAQANFSFRVETYVNGALASVDGPIFPEEGDRAHIDIIGTVIPRIPVSITSNVISIDSLHIQTIKIKVIENYGATPIDQASLESTETNAFKSGLSDEDFINTDFDNDWVAKKFLTNYPRTERMQVLRNQDIYLSMITAASLELKIVFYGSGTVPLHTYTDTQNFGIWQINLNSTILDPLIPISIDDVLRMEVSIGASEVITIEYFDEYCYSPHALLWRNEFGGFDQFIYSHNNATSGKVRVKSYRAQFGGWNGSTFDYSLNGSGQIDFYKEVTDQGILSSDYMEDTVQNWLNELFKGTFVLLYNLGGNSIPINIVESGFKNDQSRFQELIFSLVKYKKSNSNKSMST